ncbi:type II toxin-antitoxin system VapB family antitoxin [Ramlibacter tataouinensis]|uniref:Type II toxin-antitoxin system VapB family antitoxin n=1 Tax=Ramlibacter tataouinensis (strain ATCC BAA-407 / DSM 14655 / LMG 21543 / TTB310) TaxID=365046 RepID=F5Y229_RAMTT|nr:type II toxin-antitoxin system VapB family antitoxin [Ramlibacter tataouinensis]AEG94797.1 Conserved hypothetical protein [Ramlibacter tataouinensis TTB310]
MNTRTNIVLDDELVAQAMARAGVKTKKAAVEAALRAYVRKPDYSGLLALEGSRLVTDDYDPKTLSTHPRYQQALMAGEPAVTKSAARHGAGRGAGRKRSSK